MRYDRRFDILARRAVKQGEVNIEAFVEQAVEAGMSEKAITESLLADLDNDGGLFNTFFRSLTGATRSAVMTAVRQGEIVGHAAEDEELRRLLATRDVEGSVIDAALEDADPEAAEEIERAIADVTEYTWIAELRNTCERCLPLHGTTETMEDWNAAGLSPETIHEGWDSDCYCRLVPATEARDRDELMAPLRRVPIPKGGGKSKRGVLQADLDAAARARDEAMRTKLGRATLRRLGRAMEDE